MGFSRIPNGEAQRRGGRVGQGGLPEGGGTSPRCMQAPRNSLKIFSKKKLSDFDRTHHDIRFHTHVLHRFKVTRLKC